MSISANAAGILKYDFASGIKNPPRRATAALEAGVLVTVSGGELVRAGNIVTIVTAVHGVNRALKDVHGITLNDVLANVAAGYVVNPSQGITSDAAIGRDYVTGTQALGVGAFRVPTIASAAVDAEVAWKTATGWTVAVADDVVLGRIESIGSGQCLVRLCVPYYRAA